MQQPERERDHTPVERDARESELPLGVEGPRNGAVEGARIRGRQHRRSALPLPAGGLDLETALELTLEVGRRAQKPKLGPMLPLELPALPLDRPELGLHPPAVVGEVL